MSADIAMCPLGSKAALGRRATGLCNYLQQMSPPVRVLQQRWLHLQHVTLTQLGREERAGPRVRRAHSRAGRHYHLHHTAPGLSSQGLGLLIKEAVKGAHGAQCAHEETEAKKVRCLS